MSELENLFSELQNVIDQPYPDQCQEFSGWMYSAELETHLLATPRRKTALLFEKTGDYEYDEAMTLDVEVEFAVEIDKCYTQLCDRMNDVYGPALAEVPDELSLQTRIEPEDDTDDDAMTESYLSGACYDNCNDGTESFWLVGSDYVCLQKIKNWGDGNFHFHIIATVTPQE